MLQRRSRTWTWTCGSWCLQTCVIRQQNQFAAPGFPSSHCLMWAIFIGLQGWNYPIFEEQKAKLGEKKSILCSRNMLLFFLFTPHIYLVKKRNQKFVYLQVVMIPRTLAAGNHTQRFALSYLSNDHPAVSHLLNIMLAYFCRLVYRGSPSIFC